MASAPIDQLFAALRERKPDLVSPEVLELAKTHGVAPLLAHRVGHEKLPHEIAETLRAIQEDTAARNMRRVRDFAAAVTALQARGVPCIALKGMHLVPLVYHSLSARAMIDLDLLVPATRLAAAAEALCELDYAASHPYQVADDAVPYYAHHIPPFVQSGLSTIELHWHIAAPRTSVTIDISELWQRAVPARVGGVDTQVLAPEDLLLHLAVHATYNHRCEVSARACCDVAEVIRRYDLAWDAVIERARRWNVDAGTYLVLRLAHERADAPVPPHVLEALRPPDFDEALLSIALRTEHRAIGATRLRNARGVRQKLRALRDLLFIRRDDLADANNIPRSSPLVYGLYVTRAAKLIGRWRELTSIDREAAADSAVIDTFLNRSSR